MKIRRTNESKVCVELSEYDLSQLKTEYKSFSLKDENAREVLYSLLRKISKDFYCDIDCDSKLIVNYSKKSNNSSCLSLTLLKPKTNENTRIRNRNAPLIYEFKDVDSLLDAAFSSSGELLLKENSLYEKNGIYRLIVYPQGDFSSCLILNEFCNKIFSNEAHVFETLEHFNCICRKNALSSLSLRRVF